MLVAEAEQVHCTDNLSRTRIIGMTRPRPRKKLKIFATSVSQPPKMNAPPKRAEPMYPDERMMKGWPPSTRVQPPRLGSIVTLNIEPPVRIACKIQHQKPFAVLRVADCTTHCRYVT